MNEHLDKQHPSEQDEQSLPVQAVGIPTVVLARICDHLHLDHAQRTLRNVMLTSRQSYEIAAAYLYLDVYIEPGSVDSLLRGLVMEGNEARTLPVSRFPWRSVTYDRAGFEQGVLQQMSKREEGQPNHTEQGLLTRTSFEPWDEGEWQRRLRDAELERLSKYLRSVGTTEVS
jgi:hypothetical protein